jgi:hypothetical protein
MRLCDDEELTKHFALFLAELAVGHFLPPPAYYLRPMDFAWAGYSQPRGRGMHDQRNPAGKTL